MISPNRMMNDFEIYSIKPINLYACFMWRKSANVWIVTFFKISLLFTSFRNKTVIQILKLNFNSF